MTVDTTLDAADLGRITGGMASTGECFDSVWPWTLGGAATGSLWSGKLGVGVGLAASAVGMYLTTPACGDSTNTPTTQMRLGVTKFINRLRGG